MKAVRVATTINPDDGVFYKFLQTYRAAYSGLPREVWLLSTVLLINRSGAMVLLFLPLYLTKYLFFSDVQIGILIGGCYGVGSIIGAMLGGRLTSQIGPIRIQIFSQTFAIPGFLLLASANSFLTAALALFLLSVISEMVRPATTTATTLFCPRELHKKAMGHNRLAVNLGTAIGGALGGVLAGIDYQLLFYVNAGTVFCAMLATLYFFGLREPNIQQDEPGSSSAASPFGDARYLIFLGLTLMTAVVFFQLISTFPKYLDEQMGLGELDLGLLMAINTLLIVAVEMLLLQMVSKLNTLRLVAVGSLLSCLGFGLLPFGSGFWFVALTVVVWTMGEMLAMPLSAVYAASRSSNSNRGKYMGLYVTSYSASLVISPIVGMWIYENNPDVVWYIAIAIGLLTFTGFYLLSWGESEPESNPESPEHQPSAQYNNESRIAADESVLTGSKTAG